jgi:hypothetical protein
LDERRIMLSVSELVWNSSSSDCWSRQSAGPPGLHPSFPLLGVRTIHVLVSKAATAKFPQDFQESGIRWCDIHISVWWQILGVC